MLGICSRYRSISALVWAPSLTKIVNPKFKYQKLSVDDNLKCVMQAGNSLDGSIPPEAAATSMPCIVLAEPSPMPGTGTLPMDCACYLSQKMSDMRHIGSLSRREVLQDQARHSASQVEGGACPTVLCNTCLSCTPSGLHQVMVDEAGIADASHGIYHIYISCRTHPPSDCKGLFSGWL